MGGKGRREGTFGSLGEGMARGQCRFRTRKGMPSRTRYISKGIPSSHIRHLLLIVWSRGVCYDVRRNSALLRKCTASMGIHFLLHYDSRSFDITSVAECFLQT